MLGNLIYISSYCYSIISLYLFVNYFSWNSGLLRFVNNLYSSNDEIENLEEEPCLLKLSINLSLTIGGVASSNV